MDILELLHASSVPDQISEHAVQEWADEFAALTGSQVYPRSIARTGRAIHFLCSDRTNKLLAIISDDAAHLASFQGESHIRNVSDGSLTLKLCPLSAHNAAALRRLFPWLRPQVLGLKKSVGFGDRLGWATPGHVRAMLACRSGIAPIYAQQSIREMVRTARTPQQVLDDAMWGVFQEGWRTGYGADADHLKTCEDIDTCVVPGYTFYTFDPGTYVDDDLSLSDEKLEALPWSKLETTFADIRIRYLGRRFAFERVTLELDDADVRRALIKYGHAVAHVTHLYRHLKSIMGERAFEVEISVDETATPTLPTEHFIVAGELRRLGVEWVSLAPRFVGRFEKAVDYIGDLQAFDANFAAHAEVAKHWGPYKLSLHSGSDKFSIYGRAVRLAGGLVHLKTAGTSYLEALRAIARDAPDLFRSICALAFERYAEERASYHVSADPARALRIVQLADRQLTSILDQFDTRQMLHVCFGSILAQYGEQIRAVLTAHEESYYADLEKHLGRHLQNYCQ